MYTRGMTTAGLVAGIAGGLLIALSGCGQTGNNAATAPSSEASQPTSAAIASGPTTPVAPVVTTPGGSASAEPSPSASAASTDSSIQIYANCTSLSFEPTSIRVTCADGGWSLKDLTWTSWTGMSATGTGTLVYNDCKPSCVAGHFHQVPGTRIVLTDPKASVSGQLVWTRMQETPWIPGYATGPMHGEPFPLPTRPV